MHKPLSLLASLSLFSCAVAPAPDNPNSELVMTPGMSINAVNDQGAISIAYVDKYTRRYTWDGHEKTFRHQPRATRWYGSLGMYRPYGDRSMHAVLEEGQMNFASTAKAYEWLEDKERFTDCVWTKDGLVVGWNQQARPGDGFLALSVEVWQIFVNGAKPSLKGASPSGIRVAREGEAH